MNLYRLITFRFRLDDQDENRNENKFDQKAEERANEQIKAPRSSRLPVKVRRIEESTYLIDIRFESLEEFFKNGEFRLTKKFICEHIRWYVEFSIRSFRQTTKTYKYLNVYLGMYLF